MASRVVRVCSGSERLVFLERWIDLAWRLEFEDTKEVNMNMDRCILPSHGWLEGKPHWQKNTYIAYLNETKKVVVLRSTMDAFRIDLVRRSH